MKISKKKIQKYKLFKYNLLKLQTYFNKHMVLDDFLQQVEISLKQILKLIFQYHIFGFRILFVGFPIRFKKRQTKLISFTNHSFISKNSWVSGIFRNRLSIIKYLKISQSQKFSNNINYLLTIKTKPHLVVIFDESVEDNVIQEFYKGGIPIISFNYNKLNINKIYHNTLIKFNYMKKNLNSMYFFLIYSLLKKQIIVNKKNKYLFYLHYISQKKGKANTKSILQKKKKIKKKRFRKKILL